MKWKTIVGQHCYASVEGYELVVDPYQGMFRATVCFWDADNWPTITEAGRYYETLRLAKAAAVRLWKRTAKERGKQCQ